MPELTLQRVEPWTSHPAAMPLAAQGEGVLSLRGNGTRTCCGGWQLRYEGALPQQSYRLVVEVDYQDIDVPRDSLKVISAWGEVPLDEAHLGTVQADYLLPEVSAERVRFSRVVTAPAGATVLTIRLILRWTTNGESTWRLPDIQLTEAAAPGPPVRVAVVTGRLHERRGITTIADNVDFYLTRAAAAAETGADLLVLPEICLQWGLPGHVLDLAVPAPGPETAGFAELAARTRTRICLGLLERDGDAVRNTALLIAPDGQIDGRYWKVHLAPEGESCSGILPGDSFPVYETEVGRLGCNICMDSSAAESSRMVGLNGADFLLLPIMGDHRASIFRPGPPIFSADRWAAIMRVHAIDNQLCLVAARNTTEASCVVDRKGEILAWNDGDQDHIVAAVPRDDGYRMYTGACLKDVNWLQRRPHVYEPFVDPHNLGSLR
ncbi:MAG: carbon-nitrogen hydrolase family protein [Armatimonadetes bacterium]|nr:carbon-nitrogen hydrolase family protein [Armatimonadota bacterium]